MYIFQQELNEHRDKTQKKRCIRRRTTQRRTYTTKSLKTQEKT